jgi:hypothetical protein
MKSMKSSKEIIGLLVKKHSFAPLSKYLCYREFLKLLPPRLKKAVAFITVKNSRLFLVLKHPGYKMELDYNKEVIKSLLSSFLKERKECEFMQIVSSTVTIFNPKLSLTYVQTPSTSTSLNIEERAKGEFEVYVSDKEIEQILIEIKELIKARLKPK